MFVWISKNVIVRAALLVSTSACTLLFLGGGEARSSGFFLQEQSAAASGRAFAGDAAAASDASTIFYNPAGMTRLSGNVQGEIGLYMIAPQAKTSDRGSSVSVGGGAAQPVGGRSSDQGFDPGASGNLFVAAPLPRMRELWFGLGVTTPFGLKDHYALDYFGRYDATQTELRTIDVAPSVAYKIAHWLSLGAGLDVQRADAKLQTALPNPFAPGGPSPASDGIFEASGGDWGVGFNLGVLVQPTDQLRLGFSYRSGIDHTLRGNSSTEIPGVTSSAQGAAASVALPDVASLGAALDVTSTLTLMAQADYYGWSRFQNIRIHFADGTQQIISENYHNTIGFSLGAEWKIATPWTLRGGIEFDPTPSPGANRSTAIPDSNRTWLAFGVSYEVTPQIGIDMSYAHDFSAPAQINRTDAFPSLSTTVTTKGTTENSSNVVGLAMHFRY
ncbi:MAG TPA: outer membrane protein transport protein [Stellaceae bacterium]|nr:outer membrane protein transport protein [Stellaceae bacterium]